MKFLTQSSYKVKYFAVAVGFVGVLGVVLIAFSLTNQSSQLWTDSVDDCSGGGVYDITMDEMIWFDVPNFVDIVQVSLEVPQQGLLRLNLQVAEPIPLSSQDRFCFDFYFDADGDGMWDTIVFSTHGSYTYDSDPPMPPGSAGVMDMASRLLLGEAQFSVSGNILTITLDHSLVNNSTRLLAVVSHYLPSNLSGVLDDPDNWLHPDFVGLMVGFLSHGVQ